LIKTLFYVIINRLKKQMDIPNIEKTSDTAGNTGEKGREKLRKGIDASVQVSKNIMNWFKDLLGGDKAQQKEAGALIGGFLGFLTSLKAEKSEKVKDDKDKQTPKDGREQLKQEIEQSKTAQVCKQDVQPADEKSFEAITNDTSLAPAQKIFKVAELIKERGILSKNCGDFVEKAYSIAGYENNRIFSSVGKYEGRDCGEHCAQKEDLDKIEAGDWLYLNNMNTSSERGNHSVIFVGWANKEKYIANVMGFYAAGATSESMFHTYNASLMRPPGNERPKGCQPVTSIAKPVLA
jgi:hypothetical protein